MLLCCGTTRIILCMCVCMCMCVFSLEKEPIHTEFSTFSCPQWFKHKAQRIFRLQGLVSLTSLSQNLFSLLGFLLFFKREFEIWCLKWSSLVCIWRGQKRDRGVLVICRFCNFIPVHQATEVDSCQHESLGPSSWVSNLERLVGVTSEDASPWLPSRASSCLQIHRGSCWQTDGRAARARLAPREPGLGERGVHILHVQTRPQEIGF